MAELLPGVHLIEGVGFPGRPGTVNVSMLVADDGSVTLIDAGFPGMARLLEDSLTALGLTPGSVRRVIVTHHHQDHTGGLAEVVDLTGAEVWAHAADADLIDGSIPRTPPPGFTPSAASATRHAPQPVRVDLRLVGGEVLDVLGGCLVIHTPGHTLGHVSLLLPQRSLLIAGDALRYEGGTVIRPPEMYATDLALAETSLHALAKLGFERMLPYHGDYLGDGAAASMRRDLGL